MSGAAFFSSARCRLWPAHGCRCLSPSMRDKRRTWASLPRSPSPRHLYSITTPWGPGAPSACVLYVWRGRVPLTSEVRLIHPRSFVDSALPVAPSPPAHRSTLHVRRIATLGAPGPQLWRVVYGSSSFALWLIIFPTYNEIRSRRDQTHGHRGLSPPIRDKRHMRASLPRRPYPRHLCVTSMPWGPGAPSACVSHVWRGRVPLASEVRLIRTSAFIISALSVAPTPLTTTRRSMYAALPRWGPRGPICGASYKNRLRLCSGLLSRRSHKCIFESIWVPDLVICHPSINERINAL